MKQRFLAMLCGLCCLTMHAHSVEPHHYTYTLPMSEVDTVAGGSIYKKTGNGKPAIIGFGKSWTATKRLPFALGPGSVRVYIKQFIEKPARKLTVTLGDQERSVTVTPTFYRYHLVELTFDLAKATDQVIFKAELPDAAKGRTIWYSTIFTNDPTWQYRQLSNKKNQKRWGLVRPKDVPENEAGNLLPNSGFEAGIQGWDMQPYRSNLMTKPSLLSTRACHGHYSLDVGKMLIMSRVFVLKGERTYSFSIHVPEDNPLPVAGRIEAIPSNKSKFKDTGVPVLEFAVDKEQAKPCTVEGWQRAVFSFQTKPDAETRDGQYQIVLQRQVPKDKETLAKAEADGLLAKPVLVDSLQITEGEAVQAYAPYLGLEANFISPVTQAIFDKGKPSALAFNLHKAPEARVKRCVYAVYDYFDRRVQALKPLAVDADTIHTPVPFDTSRAGFFRMRTKIEYTYMGKGYVRWQDFLVNVVNPTPPREGRREQSLLGAYYYKAPVEPFGWAEVAKRFGFYEFNTLGNSLMRWHLNIARDSTPDNVRYDWRQADREVEGFRQAGIHIVAQLHLSKNYAIPKSCLYEGDKREEYFEFNGTRSKGVKFSAAKWLDYVRQFATRYKGKFGKYVIEDEPEYYFSPDEYARFFLATRKAIKAVDPDVPVFFDLFIAKNLKFLEALDRATGGKAHEHMDGMHAYLDSQHSGEVSKTASVPLRTWLREHDMPLVTVTCYSGAHRLDTQVVEDDPYYLNERVGDSRSVRNLLDGVVWGGSNCFYYYYGAHPGRSSGTYIFDEFGRVKPVFHYYAAANHLIGGHQGAASVDAFEPLRVGLVKLGDNQGRAVLYSVDGRIYDATLNPKGITGVRDGFGNLLKREEKQGKLRVTLSRYPTYLDVNDLAAAREGLNSMCVSDKLPIRFVYGMQARGTLHVRALIHSASPLKAVVRQKDPLNDQRPQRTVQPRPLGEDLYALDVPVVEPAWRTLTRKLPVELATNFGDLSSTYAARYGAITRAHGPGEDDGVIGSGEWPLARSGHVPLNGYLIVTKTGEEQARNRGSVCLMLAGDNLRGLVRLTEIGKDVPKAAALTLVPLQGELAVPQVDQKMVVTITDAKEGAQGSVQVAGQEAVPLTVAKATVPKTRDMAYEFTVPLSALPHLRVAKGQAFAFNAKAKQTEGKKHTWYLDASWHKEETLGQWGQLMIVE